MIMELEFSGSAKIGCDSCDNYIIILFDGGELNTIDDVVLTKLKQKHWNARMDNGIIISECPVCSKQLKFAMETEIIPEISEAFQEELDDLKDMFES